MKARPVLGKKFKKRGKIQTQDCFQTLQELPMRSSVTLLKWVSMNADIIVLNCLKCIQVLNGCKSLGMIGELSVGVSWG